MPLRVKCPACGARTVADKGYAGQRGPCRHCGKSFVVARPGCGCGGWIMLTVVLLLVISIPAVFFLIVDQAQRADLRRQQQQQCTSRLRRLHEALLAYHADHGAFPPAYTTNEAGEPLHSWRVLLLPYLGRREQAIYRSIRLDEPWNSPQNRMRFRTTPDAYRCPATAHGRQVMYFAVTGRDAVFSPEGAIKQADITDPASQTVLLIEAPRVDAKWMEPVDIDARTFTFADTPGAAAYWQTGHGDGAHALMADGSVHYLKNSVSLPTLRKLFNRHDGEKISARSY